MSLAQLYLSGEVRRWHANPAMARTGQTIADHQCRAAQLLLALHPAASPALVYGCLHHDVGELLAGDLSATFKDRCPDFATLHAAIEAEFLHQIIGAPLPYLTPDEVRWLKLVDWLEAMLFVIFRSKAEFFRNRSGWMVVRKVIQTRADDLGCGHAVRCLVDDVMYGSY